MIKHKLLFKSKVVSNHQENCSHEEYQLMIQCNYKSFSTYLIVDEANNNKSESIDYLYCPYCGDKLNKKELLKD